MEIDQIQRYLSLILPSVLLSFLSYVRGGIQKLKCWIKEEPSKQQSLATLCTPAQCAISLLTVFQQLQLLLQRCPSLNSLCLLGVGGFSQTYVLNFPCLVNLQKCLIHSFAYFVKALFCIISCCHSFFNFFNIENWLIPGPNPFSILSSCLCLEVQMLDGIKIPYS